MFLGGMSLRLLFNVPAYAKNLALMSRKRTDKDGNDVEIYFNPVDGSIVKKKWQSGVSLGAVGRPG